MSEQKEKYINPLIGFDFEKLFDEARIAKLTPEERKTFQANLKYHRDLKNVIDTAREEGRKEGEKEISNEIAKELKKNKVPIEDIIKYTNLTREEIENL